MISFRIKKKSRKFYPQYRFLWFIWLDIYHKGQHNHRGFSTYAEAQRELSDYIFRVDTSNRTK